MRTEQERKEFYSMVNDIRKTLKKFEMRLDEIVLAYEENNEIEERSGVFWKKSLSTTKSFFVGKKPVSVIFSDGRVEVVNSWKDVVYQVLLDCTKKEELYGRLLSMRGFAIGRQEISLSDKAEGMKRPLKITDELFIETRMNTETMLITLTEKILDAVGYDYSEIYIEYR